MENKPVMLRTKRSHALEREAARRERKPYKKSEKMKEVEKEHLTAAPHRKKPVRQTKKIEDEEQHLSSMDAKSVHSSMGTQVPTAAIACVPAQPRLTSDEELLQLAQGLSKGGDHLRELMRSQGWHC